jgi:hypothetical protein
VKVEELTTDETEWIEENLSVARELGRKYGADPDDSRVPSLEALDAIWTAFGTHVRQADEDPTFLINLIGVAFGQRLVDELGLKWGLVNHEDGSDVVVHGAGGVIVSILDEIAQRWDDGEDEFIVKLFAKISAGSKRRKG